MSDRLTIKGKITFLLLWIGISALGWFLAPINTLNPTLRTYFDVGNRILAYAGCGLILGLVMGIGQFFLLKQKAVASKKWFWMTLAGYTLALPVGLVITTLIPAISFPLHGSGFLPLREPSTISYFPFPMDIFMGGWVLGIAQWTVLRQMLSFRNSPLATIWVVGVWLSFGLGIFAMLIGRSAPVNLNSGMIFDSTQALERVYLGLASGFATGLLLLFVIHQAGMAKDRANQLALKIEAN